MLIYSILAAIAAVVAGIRIAVRAKKDHDTQSCQLDKAGRITNILLLVVYLCAAPGYMFLGMISEPVHEGVLGILGGLVSLVIASAPLFCGLGLGFSVAFRKKGKSKLSFVVQFAGLVGIGLAVGLYVICVGNLISTLN